MVFRYHPQLVAPKESRIHFLIFIIYNIIFKFICPNFKLPIVLLTIWKAKFYDNHSIECEYIIVLSLVQLKNKLNKFPQVFYYLYEKIGYHSSKVWVYELNFISRGKQIQDVITLYRSDT